MVLIPEHHILEHLQKLIRHEGQGRREAHRFASAVYNDPILTYRLRELRLRSQNRFPRHQRRQPHRPRDSARSPAAPAPADRDAHCDPHEPYEQLNERSRSRSRSPPAAKRRRSERQSQRVRAQGGADA